MRIILQQISKGSEAGRYDLAVTFNNEPVKSYAAFYDNSDPRISICNVDHELFFNLSEWSVLRYGNCAIYQMELQGILGAVHKGEPIPPLPIELGTTSFGLKRPGFLQIALNKIKRKLILWESFLSTTRR